VGQNPFGKAGSYSACKFIPRVSLKRWFYQIFPRPGTSGHIFHASHTYQYLLTIPTEAIEFITNSCIWNTCVTWQGVGNKVPEDATIVSKHVGVIIYEMIAHLFVTVPKKNCSLMVHFCFENISTKCPVGQRNLSCISPVSCQFMAATEKQMKGVATWGRSGTFINTLRHSVSARGGKVFVVCCVSEAKWHIDWPLVVLDPLVQ
jgi:hypothetical protein